MTNDERQAWLDALGDGDEVLIRVAFNDGERLDEHGHHIDRRVTGLIYVNDWNCPFRTLTGEEFDTRSLWPFAVTIEPMDDAAQERLERRRLIAKVRATKPDGLSLETLRRIVEAIEGEQS